MTDLTYEQLRKAGKSTVDVWTILCRQKLLNRRITGVRYLSDKEIEAMGWQNKSLVIFLDNGHHFFISTDDEGNDAGALFTSFPDLEVIPVI